MSGGCVKGRRGPPPCPNLTSTAPVSFAVGCTSLPRTNCRSPFGSTGCIHEGVRIASGFALRRVWTFSFLLVASLAGCAGGEDEAHSVELELPNRQIQFLYPNGTWGDYVTVGAPEERLDGHGILRRVIPFQSPSPAGGSVPYMAYWDMESPRWIQFGSTYAYSPLHDYWVPGAPMPSLMALGVAARAAGAHAD
jgi:hypothetical protein